MSRRRNFKSVALFAMPLALNLAIASANAPEQTSVRLSGHVPFHALSNAIFLEHLDSTVDVPVSFTLPLRNQEVLKDLVRRIHDPNDQEYFGKYLTSEEFNERFAPTEDDYNAVIEYAQDLGFTVTGTHSNRTLLHVKAKSADVENAFNLALHHYQRVDGRKFYAPDQDPEVSASMTSIISGIVGLDNHGVRRSYHRARRVENDQHALNVSSPNAFPSGPNGGFAPGDLLKAYNLEGVSQNGSGQIIALFELGSYSTSDINEYAQQFNLPTPQLKNILVNGGSGSGIDPEVTLDIELALALAPESQIYVYEGPNSDQGVLATYNRIATDNIAKQVSTSWGMGEVLSSTQQLNAEHAIFLQMAAHGQTMYAAAGDSGAYDDYQENPVKQRVVDDPASQPYVTAVGGTRLTVNSQTGTYQGEVVWNNGLGNGAGGGGVSVVWPMPNWQAPVHNTFSKSHRNVPDVTLNADPNSGYAIYYNGQWTIYGGTSCAAPLWAAFTALVNEARVANNQAVLGFANPTFYPIGRGAAGKTNFHDVTKGNNLFYNAEPGYDNASGWGSFNGAILFKTLTGLSSSFADTEEL